MKFIVNNIASGGVGLFLIYVYFHVPDIKELLLNSRTKKEIAKKANIREKVCSECISYLIERRFFIEKGVYTQSTGSKRKFFSINNREVEANKKEVLNSVHCEIIKAKEDSRLSNIDRALFIFFLLNLATKSRNTFNKEYIERYFGLNGENVRSSLKKLKRFNYITDYFAWEDEKDSSYNKIPLVNINLHPLINVKKLFFTTGMISQNVHDLIKIKFKDFLKSLKYHDKYCRKGAMFEYIFFEKYFPDLFGTVRNLKTDNLAKVHALMLAFIKLDIDVGDEVTLLISYQIKHLFQENNLPILGRKSVLTAQLVFLLHREFLRVNVKVEPKLLERVINHFVGTCAEFSYKRFKEVIEGSNESKVQKYEITDYDFEPLKFDAFFAINRSGFDRVCFSRCFIIKLITGDKERNIFFKFI